jgi:L-cysteine desulfidase
MKMKQNDNCYNTFLNILKKELIPATGCTEPASLAYGAAKAREVLGRIPDRVLIEASGNVIKNARSVVVPNTNDLKGIEVAVAAGIIAGDSGSGLEVLSSLTEANKREIPRFLKEHDVDVTDCTTDLIFDFRLTLSSGNDVVKLRICNRHADIVEIRKNENIILQEPFETEAEKEYAEYDCLSVERIIEFANIVDMDHVSELIEKQIAYNHAISEEGMRGDYGANIGKILSSCKDDVATRAKAASAAASDARMGGCEMPVIVLSGSGNQGITAALPILEYAGALGSTRDRLIRAVALSDLLTLHQKRFIGRLSAYCGVVCAGAASGAGIAYLHGGGYGDIAHTLVNALAVASGMICDGAKPSCAGKIALSVEAGIMGFSMYRLGKQFHAGEGIVTKGVENTIRNVGIVAGEGMRETDLTLIRLMLESEKSEGMEVSA